MHWLEASGNFYYVHQIDSVPKLEGAVLEQFMKSTKRIYQ